MWYLMALCKGTISRPHCMHAVLVDGMICIHCEEAEFKRLNAEKEKTETEDKK
jgi:hypothetical protein